MELIQGYQFLATACAEQENFTLKIFTPENLNHSLQNMLETLELETSNILRARILLLLNSHLKSLTELKDRNNFRRKLQSLGFSDVLRVKRILLIL